MTIITVFCLILRPLKYFSVRAVVKLSYIVAAILNARDIYGALEKQKPLEQVLCSLELSVPVGVFGVSDIIFFNHIILRRVFLKIRDIMSVFDRLDDRSFHFHI